MGKVREVFHRSSGPNFDPDEHSDAHGLKCEDPSRARQSDRDEADINTIVKNFGVTGRLPVSVRVPSYGDFDTVNDYQSALHVIREADQSFMQLPAEVRDRFQHSPQLFLEFCADPGNLDEMRKLGLAVPKPAPVEPAAVEPAPVGK